MYTYSWLLPGKNWYNHQQHGHQISSWCCSCTHSKPFLTSSGGIWLHWCRVHKTCNDSKLQGFIKKNHDEVEQWISYGRISLNNTDKRLLETGKCLTDKHINSSCGLLKRQFPLYGGFQSTLLQNKKIPLTSHNVIQVIYLENQKHWGVISTVDCEQNTVHYFDSLNSSVSLEAQHIIVNLLRPKNILVIKVKNVCKQTGAADCGLYAIAFCTSIVHKQNPCSVVYSQREMRIHLKMCLEQKILSQFPTLKTRRLITEDVLTVTVELCPVCMLPDDGELMVYCEVCEMVSQNLCCRIWWRW